MNKKQLMVVWIIWLLLLSGCETIKNHSIKRRILEAEAKQQKDEGTSWICGTSPRLPEHKKYKRK